MTVYENLLQLCASKGISITALCLQATGNKGNLATWKNNNGHMRSDYLSNCADILECSTDCILGRTAMKGENTLGNTTNKLHCSSDSQRAMLKRQMFNLMMEKFQDENFYNKLDKALNAKNSFIWFKSLRDISLDKKIPEMLELLDRTEDSFFSDMNIVIQSPATAKVLSLKYSDKTIFPKIASGIDVFNAVSSLSLDALSALESSLPLQLLQDDSIENAERNNNIRLAAKKTPTRPDIKKKPKTT